MHKHTPGPWMLSAHDDEDTPTWDIWAEAHTHPSKIVCYDAVKEDAELIKLAPDLYRELEDMRAFTAALLGFIQRRVPEDSEERTLQLGMGEVRMEKSGRVLKRLRKEEES